MNGEYKNYRGVRITKTIPMSVKLDLDNIKSLLDQELGADIFIKTRKREYVDARRVFVAIVYDKYDLVTNWGGGVPSGHALKVLTTSLLGDYMGYNHSTILHLRRNFDIYIQYSKELKGVYERVKTRTSDNLVIKLKNLNLEKEELLNKLNIINNKIETLIKNEDDLYKEKEEEKEEEEIITESNNKS